MAVGRPVGSRWGAALVACSMLVGASPAAADPGDVERAEEALADARDRAADAEVRLEELGRTAAIAVEDHNEAQAVLAAARSEVAEVVATLGTIQRRVRSRESSAGDLARRLYQHGAAYELEALFGAADVLEVQVRLAYLRSAAQAELNVVSELKNVRVVELAQLARLEEARAAATRAEVAARRARRTVEAVLEAQADEVARLEAEVTTAARTHAAAEDEERERIARERAEAERRERERRARELAAAAAAAAGAADPAGPYAAPSSAGEAARIAVDAALSQLGDPYRWGAAGPDAYDCSGLTSWAWAHAGVSLPHSSRMQYAVTARVPQADAQPGDLLFFGSPIHHVGMYVGDGRMIEAPYTGAQVRLNDAFVRSDLVGIGRPRT